MWRDLGAGGKEREGEGGRECARRARPGLGDFAPHPASAPLRPHSVRTPACAPATPAPASPQAPSPRSPPLRSSPFLRAAATLPAPRHARAIVSRSSAPWDPPDPRSAALGLRSQPRRVPAGCPHAPGFSLTLVAAPIPPLAGTPLVSSSFFRPTPGSSRPHLKPAFPPLWASRPLRVPGGPRRTRGQLW